MCLCCCFSRWIVPVSFATLWMTVAHQAPLFMGFFREEFWSGLLFPSPGELLEPGIKPASPVLAGRFFTTEPPKKNISIVTSILHSWLENCGTQSILTICLLFKSEGTRDVLKCYISSKLITWFQNSPKENPSVCELGEILFFQNLDII